MNQLTTEFVLRPEFVFGAKVVAILLVFIAIHLLLRLVFAKKQNTTSESKIYLYPKLIRSWHWINSGIFFVLLASGLLKWLKIIPKSWFLGIHMSFAVLFIFSWTFLVAYNMLGNFNSYKITKNTFKEAFYQIKYYLFGIFKGEKSPHEPKENSKFNALQRVSYFFVLYILMPMFIITGMLERVQPIHKIMMQTHIFFCTFAVVLFIIVHLYMVFSGDYITQKLKAMIDGYARH